MVIERGKIGRIVLRQNQWFGYANRIKKENFNATSVKLSEKFDHLFSHIFISSNIFSQGHGFDAVPVISSEYFVSLQIKAKISHGIILTWILGVASKQLRLLHGRTGDSTIVLNSLSP